jgi:hypothetical protein
MRFMMLMIPAVTDANWIPSAETMAPMVKYNGELEKAGILRSLDGLDAPSKGARVSFKGGKPMVTDGPFAETKEVLGGFWIIDVASKEEAVQWAARCPAAEGDIIEVRKMFDMSDFPEEVLRAAGLPEHDLKAAGY